MSVGVSGWSKTWKDILNGGDPRWKITSEKSHDKAYKQFEKYVLLSKGKNADDAKDVSVLCPCAGDDPFVYMLYQKGYTITAIDLVEDAMNAMKQRFSDNNGHDDDDSWIKSVTSSSSGSNNNNNGGNVGGEIIWTHTNGRVTLIVGDVLKKRSNLNNSFDAVYDKDSFGALPIELRKPFCRRMADYTKDDAIVYLECKLKQGYENKVDTNGPPYSLRKVDLMDESNYGGGGGIGDDSDEGTHATTSNNNKFEYVENLGPVYELPSKMKARGMQQTGHILRRVARNNNNKNNN